MLQLLEHVESVRLDLGRQTSQDHKSKLGQFMTPSTVARFMASLFPPATLQTCRLLDAGAGIGSLSSAFLDRWASGDFDFKRIEISSYEIDKRLCAHLSDTLAGYADKFPIQMDIIPRDFIEEAVTLLQLGAIRPFTHAILNPPYKKINSNSSHRLLLRLVGIETVNLYSAFVALAVELMEPCGQIVAIIPRSFCNGPYYRPFRDILLRKTAIHHMHLFASRNKAFRDDAVLQENVVLRIEKGGRQGDVTVSTSTDDEFSDYVEHTHPFDRIVFPNDPERFIHVPTSTGHDRIELSPDICHTLAEIGIGVSTGPIVDFRMREHLRDRPKTGAVPLLYPGHFSGNTLIWPREDIRKPNAIMHNNETEKWLYPKGCYVVVRRFSSKEENRRVVANVVYPDAFDASMIGFENHLNVFHVQKKGVPEALALGLAVFLNSTAVDEHFRRFSGHTQVNATDLRLMKYPSREALIRLGIWAKKQEELTQVKIDRGLELIA